MRVIKEGYAKRCEICHQADLYNSVKDLCNRCYGLVKEKPIIENSKKNNPFYSYACLLFALFSLVVVTVLLIGLTRVIVLGIFVAIVVFIVLASISWIENHKVLVSYLTTIVLVTGIMVFSLLAHDIHFQHTGNLSIKRLPICYGLLTREGWKAVERGECFPGGCGVSLFSPSYTVVVTY